MKMFVATLLCGILVFAFGCGASHVGVSASQQTGVRSRVVVNVRDFGAMGDGSDATSALVAAVEHLNALAGTPAALYFPKGVYLLNPLHGMRQFFGLVISSSDVEIYGEDALIGLVRSATPYADQLGVKPHQTFYWNYFQIDGSHVRVHNLTFNSNRMTTNGPYDEQHGKFWATALRFTGLPDALQKGNSVSHNRFEDIGGWAVISAFQMNFTISENYASSSEGMGCAGAVFGCTITGNVSENALDAHFFSNGSITPGTQNQNVLIAGNKALRNTNGSGIDVTASWDTVVKGNVVSGNANWCVLVGKSWGPYLQTGPFIRSQHVTVQNNNCDRNGWFQGWPMNAEIFVGEQYSQGDQRTYAAGDTASEITIKNNLIRSRNSQGRGISLGYGVARVTIDGNRLNGCAKICEDPVIRIEELGTADLTITNNHQDKQFRTAYIYIGDVGPYTVAGNDMQVHH